MQTQYKNLLRMSDPVDGGQDPFSEAAGGYDTTFPVLKPDQVLPFEIAKCEKKHNETKGNDYISLKLRLTKDAFFKDSKPARAGFTITAVIAITPTEKYSVDDVKRNTALWLKAALGVEKASGVSFRSFFDNPSQLEGSVVLCRTSVKKADGSFPEGTNLAPVIPAA